MFAYSEIRELKCICFVRTGLDGDPQIIQTSSIKIQWDGTQMEHDNQYFHGVISQMLCARLRMPFQMLISFPKNPLTWEPKWKDRADMHHMVVFWVSDRRARKSSHISSKYHSVTQEFGPTQAQLGGTQDVGPWLLWWTALLKPSPSWWRQVIGPKDPLRPPEKPWGK